ncbi:MAG: hypothetical protein WC346_06540 [Methanogenium sp.]|jgi:hypothetical protein
MTVKELIDKLNTFNPEDSVEMVSEPLHDCRTSSHSPASNMQISDIRDDDDEGVVLIYWE